VTRGRIAAAILVLWAVALGALAYRQAHRNPKEALAEAAIRVEPSAYYYRVYQDTTQVGVASSVIDTARGHLRTTDFFRGRLIIAGDTQEVEGSAVGFISPTMALDSFAITVGGDQTPIRIRGTPKTHVAPVYLPTFTPVTLMLTGNTAVGRSEQFWVYNPLAREVQRATLRVQAESLFTVSDSARFDSTASQWVSAHRDTVRAWSVAPPSSGYTVWVDAAGRIVSAREVGGLSLMRAAYEESFSNWRIQHP